MGVYGSIQVTKGAELTLGSTDGNVLNIRSAEGMNNDAPDMLNIEGTCNMYSGMTLSGREGNNYFGGGVAVAASYEEISGGLGNLKSSVEILGESRDCMLKTLKYRTTPLVPRTEWVAACWWSH